MSSSPKILILGAAGYIGGEWLNHSLSVLLDI